MPARLQHVLTNVHWKKSLIKTKHMRPWGFACMTAGNGNLYTFNQASCLLGNIKRVGIMKLYAYFTNHKSHHSPAAFGDPES